VATRNGIVNAAVTRQLIRFLPVLSPALPIPLPGDRAVAAERRADLSER
jgi:hypothetical protein